MGEPLFLGLSTGRAGSRYLTSLLNRAGIPTIHEKNLSPPTWNAQGCLGEVSAHLVVKGPDTWPRAKVWHFSRHPQPFVTSLIKFGFWRMHAPAIHPFLQRTGNTLADSYRYWLEWNRRILEVPSDRRTTFRIEDVSPWLIHHLAETIGHTAKLDGLAPKWNERQAFAPIPDEVAEDVHAMMEALGYC